MGSGLLIPLPCPVTLLPSTLPGPKGTDGPEVSGRALGSALSPIALCPVGGHNEHHI